MKILKIKNETIIFDNGTELTYHHDQDCCERVYADFDQIDKDSFQHEFNDEIKVEEVEGAGFRLEGYFIPCYNEQNGYYGSDLEIQVNYPDGRKVAIDISNGVEDRINE